MFVIHGLNIQEINTKKKKKKEKKYDLRMQKGKEEDGFKK